VSSQEGGPRGEKGSLVAGIVESIRFRRYRREPWFGCTTLRSVVDSLVYLEVARFGSDTRNDETAAPNQ